MDCILVMSRVMMKFENKKIQITLQYIPTHSGCPHGVLKSLIIVLGNVISTDVYGLPIFVQT